eukprot:CAMPEP_0117687858 /NCGR_PEP_ID=MMETSP0804-20121206/23414_1 /TAXON_ID=1074897 /ORGANISM="Tetraselmis astigmatica, Strain CCMP880" /LENGTH=545 /DNA_ID=CAMNT_0005500059 /DNA_START=334 /DNA_END=1971 /DNA_ORIENTATION=-
MGSQLIDSSGAWASESLLQMDPTERLFPGEVEQVFGYPRNVDDRYKPLARLGTGSFGVVTRVQCRDTGVEYACKSISKVQRGKSTTTPRYLLKIQNEVECMHQLGASLDAVALVDVFEDSEYIHLIMELCTGGPLMQAVNISELTEERIADLMRSVLRFIAQCHSKNLVYRDINHVNFLFSDTSPEATLKATDFGLAMRRKPTDPPIQSRAGTPIYMAPEVIDRSYGSQADVWSAGVLLYLLLTGRYPYFKSSIVPPELSIAELFTIILSATIDLTPVEQAGVSPEAVDLLRGMLQKDPAERMTAAQALEHPWIQDPAALCCSGELGCSVLQRMQRFAVSGQLKQHVLNLIADDIIEGNIGLGGEELLLQERRGQLEPLLDLFERVDGGQSGEVVVEDLVRSLQEEGYLVSDVEVEKLASRLDINSDGIIFFDEFSAALLDWQVFQNQRSWKILVRHAFDQIDLDGDGLITFKDVLEALTNPFAAPEEREIQAKQMLHECDSTGDGRICLEEFEAMVNSDPMTSSSLMCYDGRYYDSCEIKDESS